VNDGSTDNTSEVFVETVGDDSRFSILSIPNCGVAAARNAGYSELSDKVTHVTFMDADDAYIVGGLDSLLDHLLTRPDVRAVHGLGTFELFKIGIDRSGQYEQFGLDRATTKWGVPYRISSCIDTTLESIILKSTMFPPGLVLVERSLLTEVGLFNVSKFIHHADDWHFMIRLSIAGPITFLPKSVLLYRRHESNAGAARTIPVACGNVWRLIYWNPDNSAEVKTRLFFAWKAKQVFDLQQRASVFWKSKTVTTFLKLIVGLLMCTCRWIWGAPRKRLEKLKR
jgi:glycosyltransferase involved in cell wall biosynthesis